MKLLTISLANFYEILGWLSKSSQPSAAPSTLSMSANLAAYLDIKVIAEIFLNVNEVSLTLLKIRPLFYCSLYHTKTNAEGGEQR